MRFFYLFMAVASRYELEIARAYSSNRVYIAQLAQDAMKWEGELLKYTVRHTA